MSAPLKADEPRRVVSIRDFPQAPQGATQRPERERGRAARHSYYEWYDWAVVWRYWNGMGQGVRLPYMLEILELLRLGEGMSSEALAIRLGMSSRQILRWRERFTP